MKKKLIDFVLRQTALFIYQFYFALSKSKVEQYLS